MNRPEVDCQILISGRNRDLDTLLLELLADVQEAEIGAERDRARVSGTLHRPWRVIHIGFHLLLDRASLIVTSVQVRSV